MFGGKRSERRGEVDMTPTWRIVFDTLSILLAATILGCGKVGDSAKPLPPSSGSKPKLGSPEFSEMVKSNVMKREVAEAALRQQLEGDPQPIFHFAVTSIMDALPDKIGDANAKVAKITVDKESLKTFGPGKWTVRGHLSAKDSHELLRETTWQVGIAVSAKINEDSLDWRKNTADAYLITAAVGSPYGLQLDVKK